MDSTPRRRFANILFRAIFTTLGAVAEIFAIALLFDISSPLYFIIIAFFLISITYLWDFYSYYYHELTKSHRGVAAIIIVILIIGFFVAMFMKNKIVVASISVTLVILELIYHKYLNEISKMFWAFKDIITVFFWNTFILLFLLYSGVTGIASTIFFLVFVFTRDLVNIAYCDLKDISTDRDNNFKTFATLLGKGHLFRALTIINLFSILWIILGVSLGLLPSLAYFLIAPVFLTTILIPLSRSTQVYSTTTVDFEYYGWLLFLLIGKLFF